MDIKKLKDKLRRHSGIVPGMAVVALFVAAGLLTLQYGGAATYAASTEAEAGTVAGGATKVSVTGASGSGNNAVRFGMAPPLPSSMRLGTYKLGACALADACRTTNGPPGADSYGTWLGRTMMVGQDNTGNEAGGPTWGFFENGWPDSFTQWRDWKQQVPGRKLALAVPMFLTFEPGTSAQKLTYCARGDYDAHYRALGTSLQSTGLGDTIVRIGWEAHFTDSTWSYHLNPTDWKPCWRRIATQMKSTAPNLITNWNMGDREAMRDAVNLRGFDNFYPGDDVVDELGIDTYDVNAINENFDELFNNEIGNLGWWVQQATQRNKPLTIPEWGLWDNRQKNTWGGSRDDVEYINRMHAFITNPANRVTWSAYFDYNVGDYPMHQLQPNWRDGTIYPNASARFKQLFGSP